MPKASDNSTAYRAALKLTLLCLLSILPVWGTAVFGPQSGLETLVIIVPGMAMVGAHVLFGPIALLYAWRSRGRPLLWLVGLYFLLFASIMIGYWASVKDVPEKLRHEWRDVVHPEDAALSLAISNGSDNKDDLDQAIDAGARLDTLTPEGRTPLIEAVMYGNVETVRRLLSAGANPNLVTETGTALYYATVNLQVDIVRELLIARADPNLPIAQGLPACRVLRTVATGQLPARQQAVIDALFTAGADMGLPCKKGSTHSALHTAIGYGMLDFVQTANAKGQRLSHNQRQRSLGSALFKAVKAGDSEWLSQMLAVGVHPDAKQSSKQKVLAIAIREGNVTMVKALLSAGASVREDDYIYQVSRLYDDRVDLLRLLLDAGATIDNERKSGALYQVARRGWKTQVELMLAAHADPDAPDKNGKTLLFNLQRLPAKPERIALIPVLLAAGATVDARDEKQRTPFMMAIFRQDHDIAARFDAAGADINAVDADGNSAAHHSVTLYDGLATVQWLLSAGSDFSLRNNRGEVPACIARQKRKYDVVDAIARQGQANSDCVP